MKASLVLTAALAAGAHAAVIDARQRLNPRITGVPDVGDCNLDAFIGHTSEALVFCSNFLKSGTATKTATVTTGATTIIQTTTYVTLYPPTTSSKPVTTSKPITTSKPPTTSSKPLPPTTTSSKPSTIVTSPTPSASAGCGLVGYTKDTAAYYFDSSGTKNTFAACSAACKADAQCKSFGYGEANCMLFTVDATSNTNYNPMSPYTFYDVSCPKELPVRKRQIYVSIGLGTPAISSACSCLITSGPADVTKTTSITVTSQSTSTQTVTRTVSLLPGIKAIN